jgi:DNA invertase Pin-like site-specific DNA recombinase
MADGIWAYCRVSTTKEEQELSLAEQERWAKGHSEALGQSLTAFQERASAKNTVGRPVFQHMMASLQDLPPARRPRQIAVTSLDRLSRDMTDTLLVARTLRDLGVELLVRDMGVLRADTFAERAALVGQSMGGEAENEARSRRARASWERRRREGKPTSNKVPYGLQLQNERDVPASESCDWVKQAFEWYAGGLGAHTIAKRFKDGAPPHRILTSQLGPDGKRIERSREHVWEYNRVLKLLRQRRYRDTLVKPELFDRVQELQATKPRWRQSRKGEYPLSGAVKCAGCGRSFHGRSSSSRMKKKLASGETTIYSTKRIRYYECIVCNLRINAEAMETTFRNEIGKLVGDKSLLRRWLAGERPSSDLATLKREIASLERATSPDSVAAARARVWELALAGPHAASDLEKQLAWLSAKNATDAHRLADLRARLANRESGNRSVDRVHQLLETFWSRYDKVTYEQKRELMSALTSALGGVNATKTRLVWHRPLQKSA